MFPVLIRIGGVPIATHDVLVALGITLAAVVFRTEVRRRGVRDERIWYVVAGVVVGGALLARLGTWAPDAGVSAATHPPATSSAR